MSGQERAKLYNILDIQTVAEIFSYIDDVQKYLEELTIDKAAKVVSYMDADDAVDVPAILPSIVRTGMESSSYYVIFSMQSLTFSFSKT